jgi:aldose 1-epimerase
MSDTIFGTLPTEENVLQYILQNSRGAELNVINFGATITSLQIPSKEGKTDVVLGFDKIEDYIASQKLPAPPHFGAVIGRYAGRIKNGRFTIGDKEYRLNINNNSNTLHGGINGFDRVLWQVTNQSENAITFKYLSADGEENFPGELTVEVTYTLTEENEVIIEYKATSTEDTIINLTQHTYFNLDGPGGSVTDQELVLNANKLLEIDTVNIPTGKIIEASAKGFDFSNGGNPVFGIDDSYIVKDNTAPAAVLKSNKTGLKLLVYSDQPSVHIYVGGNLFGKLKGKDGVAYNTTSGICFESQNYPDAPNQPDFPDAVLKKGDTYTQKTIWKFELEA